MNHERFNYLLTQFQQGSLTAAERDEWLALADSMEFRAAMETEIEATIAAPMEDARWDASIDAAVWAAILKDTTTAAERKRWFRLPLAAAVAAAVIGIALGVWWFGQSSQVAGPEMVSKAPRGGRLHLVLTDGTGVWLDAASTLRYPAGFTGRKREVRLEGRAYFEVQTNSNAPFIVTAGDQKIEVLGTRFTINAYAGDAAAHTTLLQGSVRVSRGQDSLLLHPGQEARAIAGAPGLQLFLVDTMQSMAWKENVFSFQHTSYCDAMRQLERWYDVAIDCGTGADTLFVSGVISCRNSLEEVLKIFSLTNNIHYTLEGKKVRVVIRGH